jgi:hypothetical protein
MSAEWTDESLRSRLPEIPWDEPLTVHVGDKQALVCRYCVACDGLRGIDVMTGASGFPNRKAFNQHLRFQHDRSV